MRTPVFVDSSGRRAKLLRRTGMLVGVLCLGNTAVLGMAFTDWGGSPLTLSDLPRWAASGGPSGNCPLKETPPCSIDSGSSDRTSPTKRFTPSAPISPPVSATAPDIVFAPYISATAAARTDGTTNPATYNLAFVVAKSTNSCTPLWDGVTSIDDEAVASRIQALKDAGGDIRVSFGGQDGTELALACDSADELADAYAEVMDATGATHADFDIEGSALPNSAANDRRAEAVAQLQKKRDLEISYTVPVTPEGLTQDTLAVIKNARSRNVRISEINIMAMNYGAFYQGDMSDHAESAAQATHNQLVDVLGLTDHTAWSRLAITVMIGINNVETETFTLDDAAAVHDFAKKKDLAWLSMWSSLRDQECPEHIRSKLSPDCSGVEQETGAFATALAGGGYR